jgi:YbgC/YbaW family acyl-CoA thioester hydrolase
MAGMHEMRIRIRPTQVDTFGHLNNAAYLELFEWARWEWAEVSGLDIERLATEQRIGPAVLHVDLSFTKEIRMHEAVAIQTWVQQLQRVKGVMGQRMLKADGQPAAQLWLTFAMFNLDKRRAVAMPDGLQTAYQADAGHRAQLAEKTAKK